jgi:hypothetical protein
LAELINQGKMSKLVLKEKNAGFLKTSFYSILLSVSKPNSELEGGELFVSFLLEYFF